MVIWIMNCMLLVFSPACTFYFYGTSLYGEHSFSIKLVQAITGTLLIGHTPAGQTPRRICASTSAR
jgi:hypothetical protein